MVFKNWERFRDAVHGTAGGENDVLNASVEERIHEIESICDVVLEVLARLTYGFSNVGMRGKMDSSDDAVAPNGMADCTVIRKVCFDKRTPLDGPRMTGREVVEDNWLETRSRQRLRGVAADVTCTTCDKNSHRGLR